MVTDDRIHAVLIEPQLERFRRLCGLDGVELAVTFAGWHRYAVLAPDRVFLFPRDRSRVAGLLREAAVVQALEGRGIPAPRLLGQWHETGISPYPFIAVSRLPGRTWLTLEREATLDQIGTMLESLGRAIASWHRLDPRVLPRRLRTRRQDDLSPHLEIGALESAAWAAVRALSLPRRQLKVWLQELEPLATMPPVFVHGDINEGQLMVDGHSRVTGVLDWETAAVGHPLKDFDFGEWGYGIFAWERRFDLLRRRMWEAYARARGGELPGWRTIHLFFCLTWIDGWDPAVPLAGWSQDRLAGNLELLRRLTV